MALQCCHDHSFKKKILRSVQSSGPKTRVNLQHYNTNALASKVWSRVIIIRNPYSLSQTSPAAHCSSLVQVHQRLWTTVLSRPSFPHRNCSPLCVYSYDDPIPLPSSLHLSLPLLSAAPLQLHQSRVCSRTHTRTQAEPFSAASSSRQRVLCDRRRRSVSISRAPASTRWPRC